MGGSLRAVRGGTSTHTVGAAPFALRSPVKLRIKADEVVGTRAGVTQNNFPTLLAHLTVILVIRLVAINLLLPGHCRTAQDCHIPQWRQREERKREGERNAGGERKRKGFNKEVKTTNKKDNEGMKGRLNDRTAHS